MLITLSMLLPKLGLDVRKSWTSFASALNVQQAVARRLGIAYHLAFPRFANGDAKCEVWVVDALASAA